MSRRKIALLAVAGLLVYLGFLVIRLPAAQAWRLVENQVPVRATGLSGTLWSGQATSVYQGERRLDSVAWELRPGALLTGRIAADLRATLPGGRVRTHLVRGVDLLRLEELRLDVPARTLLDLAGEQRINADGHVEALLREVLVVDEVLRYADGLINWRNAVIRPGSGLPLGNVALPLGDLALRLEPTESGMRGTLLSQDSPLEIQGQLTTDPEQRRFTMDLVLRVVGELDANTRKALQMLGVPADGSPSRSRLTGNLDGSDLRLTPR